MTDTMVALDVQFKYRRSGLKPRDIPHILKRISDYMVECKPYLDRNFCIHGLADAIHVPRHHVTQVLNEYMHKNFNEFVNDYRISEFKRRLMDPVNHKYTIIAIAFESGFNSKTSFNMVFKKYERMTPSQYRRFREDRLPFQMGANPAV